MLRGTKTTYQAPFALSIFNRSLVEATSVLAYFEECELAAG